MFSAGFCSSGDLHDARSVPPLDSTLTPEWLTHRPPSMATLSPSVSSGLSVGFLEDVS